MLIALLSFYFNHEFDENGELVYKWLFDDIVVGDASLNMSRIVCSFLLHISIVPEIKSAKEMMSFTKKNVSKFSGQRFEYPMLFALFKLTGGAASFFANICFCIFCDSIVCVVTSFVAVMVINEVDNLMMQTVTEDDCFEDLRLFTGNNRMKRSDIQIWNERIKNPEIDAQQ